MTSAKDNIPPQRNENQQVLDLQWTIGPRSMTLMYLFLVYALLCSLACLSASTQREFADFMFVSVAFLSAISVCMALLERKPQLVSWLALFAFLVLAALPVFMFRVLSGRQIVFICLYYVLLVATPALLSVWRWWVQSFVGLVSVVAVSFVFLDLPWSVVVQSTALVIATAIMSSLVSYRRSAEWLSWSAESGEEAVEAQKALRDYSLAQLPQRVWNVALLQGGLLAVLIFFEAMLAGGEVSYRLPTKVFGFIVVIFSSLLLSIIKGSSVARTVVFTTVLVGIALGLSETFEAQVHVLRGAIPIVFLAFTTVNLPWRPLYQTTLSWLLILTALVIKTIPFWQLGSGPLEGFYQMLTLYRVEIAVLVAGVSLSVLVSRWLSEASFRNAAVSLGGQSLTKAVADKEAQNFPRTSQEVLHEARAERLLLGLFALGICSSFYSSTLLANMPHLRWTTGGVTWLVFLLCWGALLFIYQRKYLVDQLWFFGTVLALVLFLWPSILLVYLGPQSGFWFLWPLSVLLGIGMIPWGAIELVPLVVANSVAAVEIIDRLHLGPAETLLFIVCGALSLLLSIVGARRLKSAHLFHHFFNSVSRTTEPKQAVELLADFLMSLFVVRRALISSGDGDLFLIRGKQLFPVLSGEKLLSGLARRSTPAFSDSGQARLHIIRWLPGELRFYNRRFGMFWAEHGILVELNHDAVLEEGDSPLDTNDTSSSDSANPSYLFLGFRLPFIESLRGVELKLAYQLVATTGVRLQYFRERLSREEEQHRHWIIQSERELELSTLVHDINNTVQDLTVVCDAILEDVVGDDEQVEAVSVQSEGLPGRVKRIAAIARSMATVLSDAKRKRELERFSDLGPRELVEVRGVLTEIMSFAIIRAERKRITVASPDLPDEEVWVRISASEHLETILRNLLNNGIKYSDPGSSIAVTLRCDSRWVWIDVRDTGPGLSVEECESIFLTGFRGESGKRFRGGLGIGLAQSRRVAKGAGGELNVHSDGLGKGSTFTLSLPRQPAPGEGRLEKSWALMVDDQPTLTDFYARIAKALHLNPLLASSVGEATQLVEKWGKPKFVLTDIQLGSSNGLDLIRLLREEFGTALPILVVSGLPDKDIEQQAREAGATDFVAKPVGRRALFARIQSLLS